MVGRVLVHPNIIVESLDDRTFFEEPSFLFPIAVSEGCQNAFFEIILLLESLLQRELVETDHLNFLGIQVELFVIDIDFI